MQIMTLKQWHSNDRKSKINTNMSKKMAIRKAYYYWAYYRGLNLFKSEKRLRIIKDLRLKLLQTGS